MKIAVLGFPVTWGKVKYIDKRLLAIEEKSSPQKTHPFFVDLISDVDKADAIICSPKSSLDLFVADLEKIEKHIEGATQTQKELLQRCSALLEKETSLYEGKFTPDEFNFLKNLFFLTLKPLLVVESLPSELSPLIEDVFKKAGFIFFYTLAKLELKSWLIEANSSIIKAAEKIHSDLAKGFIKAEVINFEDFMKVHNLAEARARGLVKIVGRDYVVQDADIIEIKFKV